MNLLRHFVLKRRIDQTLTLQSALALECGRDDFDTKMRLAAWAGAGMPGVTVGFVDDLKALRVERRGQPFPDPLCNLHRSTLAKYRRRLGAGGAHVKPDEVKNTGNAGLRCPACLALTGSSYCCNAAYGDRNPV
jgi:hypothetical protein